MDSKEVKAFINTYRRFYIIGDKKGDNKPEDEEYDLCGIPRTIMPVDNELEAHIIEKINQGHYDAETFAWKAGKAKWENGQLVYNDPLNYRWVNGNGCEIKVSKDGPPMSKEDFEEVLKNNNDLIMELVNSCDLTAPEGRKDAYIGLLETMNLYNFGAVNLINMLFFLSKGDVPIYDYFAHLGLKALYLNKSPLEVAVPSSPGKDEHPRGGAGDKKKNYYLAINVLEEYIWMLKEVFTQEIHKDGSTMYISREIDQALWVYGHAYIQYPPSEHQNKTSQ